MTEIEVALWANNVQRLCLLEAGDDVVAGLAAADHIISTQKPITLPADNAFFAHDIHNRKAQGILNKTLKAARNLTDDARKDLVKALEKGPVDSGQAILDFISKYRTQLVDLLTTTQLAALLEGAREVATRVPALEEDTNALGAIPQPKFKIDNSVHLPTIDEATKSLAERNVLTRQDYEVLDSAARAKALAVANVDAEETLVKIRDALSENVKKGADYETFKQEILSAVDEGTFLSDGHMETVFRTSVQTAFSDGQMTVLQNPLVRNGFPYAAYDSIHDDRARDEHNALDKHGIDGSNIYRSDDPVFQLFRPPWSWGCRCSWTPLTVRQAAEKGIKEAQRWLATGSEPTDPAFVPMPDFQPPEGFQRSVAHAPLSIRLSMQPTMTFAHKPTQAITTSSIDPDTYPRNKANQFLDKYLIAEAARNPEQANELRESIPEDQRAKLDHLISRLQWGETIHHPNEPPGMAIDINGTIVDGRWELYAEDVKQYEAWEEREEERGELRKKIDTFLKAMRNANPVLKSAKALNNLHDRVQDQPVTIIRDEIANIISPHLEHFESASKLLEDFATDSELRQFERKAYQWTTTVRQRVEEYVNQTKRTSKDGDTKDLDDAFESLRCAVSDCTVHELLETIAEEAHGRIDTNEKEDEQPLTPIEPVEGVFSQGGWITIGGKPDQETGEKHVGGFRVFIDGNGVIQKGRLKGKNVKEVKSHFDSLRSRQNKETPPDENKQRSARDDGVSRQGSSAVETISGPVARETERPNDSTPTQVRKVETESVGTATATGVPRDKVERQRVAADAAKVNQKLDRYEKLFNERGDHQTANLMAMLRSHINALGPETALASLGEYRGDQSDPVAYTESRYWSDSMGDFTAAYLGRYGITSVEDAPAGAKVVSPFTRDYEDINPDFKPVETPYDTKLDEAKDLPGLETTEDVSVIMGRKTTHLTDDVFAKMDERFGKGSWIIKTYGDDAFAGQGIFFPQLAAKVAQDARNTIWASGSELSKYGFSHYRDKTGNIIGIQHQGGDVYEFGTEKYNNTIQGDARYWADAAANVSQHEKGMALPNGGENFMAQPAFPIVGVTEEERAQGKTIVKGEGRVHVVVRNGKAEVIPHSTWIKGEHFPVVFENDDTRAMARAAQEAIDKLPEKARTGQIYGPDIVRTTDGFKVVELNAAVYEGGSGYLGDNPFIIDAYVSYINGRTPGHVDFIRKLLTKRQHEAAALALSLALAIDAQGREHKGKGKGGGQFVSSGSSETTTEDTTTKSKSSLGKLVEVAKKAGAAEHYATKWVGERVNKLPALLRVPLKMLYYIGFSAFITGQRAAKEVAREVGGDEHADRIGRTLAVVDNVAAIGAKVASVSGVSGPHTAALVVPVASTTYLAYASVRHPVATFNAASKGVKAALEKLRGKKHDGQTAE